jgi:hypothetical protein
MDGDSTLTSALQTVTYRVDIVDMFRQQQYEVLKWAAYRSMPLRRKDSTGIDFNQAVYYLVVYKYASFI